jgi:flagellar hook-associated protein 2
MNLQIDNWDVRLAAKQLSLSKTYSDLETALGKLKNQSTWLSGQISSLA